MTGKMDRRAMLEDLGVDVDRVYACAITPEDAHARLGELLCIWRETEERYVEVGDVLVDLIADRENEMRLLENLLHKVTREHCPDREACEYAAARKLRPLPHIRADAGRRAYIRAQIRQRKGLRDLEGGEMEREAAVLIRQEQMIGLYKEGLKRWLQTGGADDESD